MHRTPAAGGGGVFQNNKTKGRQVFKLPVGTLSAPKAIADSKMTQTNHDCLKTFNLQPTPHNSQFPYSLPTMVLGFYDIPPLNVLLPVPVVYFITTALTREQAHTMYMSPISPGEK